MNYKKISLMLCLGLSVAFTSCYKEDPLKEKERQIETGKEKPEDPKNEDKKNEEDKKPTEEPKKEELTETTYSFELWAQVPNKPYSVPLLNADEDPAKSYWVSASNTAYVIFSGKSPYPVEPLEQGYKGKGVRISTKEGLLFTFPGSLYSGLVEEKNIFSPAKFGQPWGEEPVELSFYYQYKAGEEAIKDLPNNRDHASVQGVLYEVTNDEAYLSKENIKEDVRIVSRAYTLLSDSKEGEWISKTIKFEPVSEEVAKAIDFKTKKYRLALILSSSAKGDELKGATGSTLLVDELTLKSKPNK